MTRGHVWTFTIEDPNHSGEDIPHYPTWLVWTDINKMRAFVLQSLTHEFNVQLERELTPGEIGYLASDLEQFMAYVKVGQENTEGISYDSCDDAEHVDMLVVRVWSLTIQE